MSESHIWPWKVAFIDKRGHAYPNQEPYEEEDPRVEYIRADVALAEVRRGLLQQLRGQKSLQALIGDRDIFDLGLSVRPLNCLRAAKIYSIAKLVTYSDSDLLKFRNFGRKSLNEIRDALDATGLHLGMTEEEAALRVLLSVEVPQ